MSDYKARIRAATEGYLRKQQQIAAKAAEPRKPRAVKPPSSRPGASERDVSALICDAAELMGITLFRNNVGALQDKFGRWITYGLCVGSSDRIGWQTVTVTPDMVGQRLAVFVAVETKRERGGVTSERQGRFIARVNAAGGRAGVARSVEDLQAIVTNSVTSARK